MTTQASSLKMPLHGVVYALTGAVLFGITTPLAKLLLHQINPQLLAGLFYLGSGLGLICYQLVNRPERSALTKQLWVSKADRPWLAGAILAGGIVAPVLLMLGLATTSAATSSLLLNLEGIFTALIAWYIFKENYDSRVFIGMCAIVLGGVVLCVNPAGILSVTPGILLIAGASLGWAIDNNLTKKVTAANPAQVAGYKGLLAGIVNTIIAISLGTTCPKLWTILLSLTIGFLGYGVSLVLYVMALRSIGAARSGAYFSLAPFVGALLAVVLFKDHLSIQLVAGGLLMGIGLWLHLTEVHSHKHRHDAMDHEHEHIHDEHHQHEHGPNDPVGEPHSHLHHHQPLLHSHPHFPDLHHNHDH